MVSDLCHTKGLQVPRTYHELIEAPVCHLCGVAYEWNAVLKLYEHDDPCLVPRKDGSASQGDSDAARGSL